MSDPIRARLDEIERYAPTLQVSITQLDQTIAALRGVLDMPRASTRGPVSRAHNELLDDIRRVIAEHLGVTDV